MPKFSLYATFFVIGAYKYTKKYHKYTFLEHLMSLYTKYLMKIWQ